MINKKNLLGKTPDDLGAKDAIHVAIVAVRAARPIKPGERCKLNQDREAVGDSSGPGVADPFLKKNIQTGQIFWMLLAEDEVPNVVHQWEHPDIDFSPPKKAVKRNATIESFAKDFGVTYEQIMAAADSLVYKEKAIAYPGDKSAKEVERVQEDSYEFWSEWAEETGYEFPNNGTECCPKMAYPEGRLFIM